MAECSALKLELQLEAEASEEPHMEMLFAIPTDTDPSDELNSYRSYRSEGSSVFVRCYAGTAGFK